MTTQKAGIAEEQFAAAINAMQTACEKLENQLDDAYRRLGWEVADNPTADHARSIEVARIAEAKHAGARDILSIALGFKMGVLAARPADES